MIGAGVNGLLSALRLNAEGRSVYVVDKGAAAREASWAGGGILSPLFPWRCADAVSELARYGHETYPALADELYQETDIDPEWLRCGMLYLDREQHCAAQRWSQRWGYVCETLVGAALATVSPALAASAAAAFWFPDVAQIRPPRLGRALLRLARRRGIEIAVHMPAKGLALKADRVAGVRFDRGVIAARTVLLTAGAWSGDFLQGVAGAGALPVQPVKGQMAALRHRPGRLGPVLLSADRYLIQRRDGCVLVGSTVEFAGYDKTTDAQTVAALRRDAVALVPELAHAPLARAWAGLRPGKCDNMPVIGPHPALSGLFINAGHYRNGIILAPGSARLITDLMMQRAPWTDPQPFAAPNVNKCAAGA